MRELKRLQGEIMVLYGKLTARQRARFLDFILFLNEVCDNEKSPVPGQREQGMRSASADEGCQRLR